VVQALEGLKGVRKATASNSEKKAAVVYDPGLVSFENIKNALMKAGYVAALGGKLKPEIIKSNMETNTEFDLDDLVCFCFHHTRKDIEQDYYENGQSTIMAKIASEKKARGCDCAIKNPKGR